MIIFKINTDKKESKILTLIKQTFDSFNLNVSNILFDQIQAMFSLKRPATFELLVLYFLFDKKKITEVFLFLIFFNDFDIFIRYFMYFIICLY